jgi:F0F1-type ATP synthase membrane subunit c/vacuolar-type H+-ATPase subunit K
MIMSKSINRIFISVVSIFLFFFILPLSINAQDVSLGIAIVVPFNDKDVQDGDIVSSDRKGAYIRSRFSYDPFIFGVVSIKPALYLYDKATTEGFPVINSGKAYVRVSTEKGDIKRGDQITSSTNPGVGIKATENGYIIGTAEEDYSAKDPKQIGKILVVIYPHFAQTTSNLAATLLTFPRLSFTEALQSPSTALRYLLAALITAATLLLGFRFFGNVSTKGLEALGRNPLAKRSILLGIAINSVLIIGVMIFGLAVAYLILAF